MLTIHDCTPAIRNQSELPAAEKLAPGMVIGELGRTTAYCIESKSRWNPESAELPMLREAQSVGLIRALSTFPVGVEFRTGDSDGMIVINEDGTRGAIIRAPRLNPLNHDEMAELVADGLSYRAGGGVPDVD